MELNSLHHPPLPPSRELYFLQYRFTGKGREEASLESTPSQMPFSPAPNKQQDAKLTAGSESEIVILLLFIPWEFSSLLTQAA